MLVHLKCIIFFFSKIFFLFFSWTVYASYLQITSEGKITLNKSTYPLFPGIEFFLHSEEIAEEFFNLYKKNNEEVKKNDLALQFLNLNVKQIASILNEDTLIFSSPKVKSKISFENLNELYELAEVLKIISFIKQNQLSPQHTLILLLPFLQSGRLTDLEIIEILEAIKFNPNTILKVIDIVSVLVSSEDFHFQKKEQDLKNENLNQILDSLKKLLKLNPESFFKVQSEEELLKQLNLTKDVFLEPELIITSLPHIAMLYYRKDLIKYFYEHFEFDPQIVDHAKRTPLHLLLQTKLSSKTAIKDTLKILDIVFRNEKVDINSKDIHGLVPLATAIFSENKDIFFYFFENRKLKKIDFSAKDNYNRTLAHFASQSEIEEKEKIIALIVKLGDHSVLVPDFFRRAINQNFKSIQIKSLHPLQNIILVIKDIIIKKIEKEQVSKQDVLLSLAILQKYYKKITNSEKIQDSLKNSLEQSHNPYEQSVMRAIKHNDRKFFEETFKFQEIKELVNSIFSYKIEYLTHGISQIKDVPAYHLLLYAIKKNAPDVVSFLVENIKNPFILSSFSIKENSDSYYMDPLSEALLNVSVLNLFSITMAEEDYRQKMKNSEEIIDILMNTKKINNTNFMNLTPRDIAYLTGQKKQEEKLASYFPKPEGEVWKNVVVFFREVVKEQGFKNMSSERNTKETSSCKSVFH
ncbi:MAG: hypothetical protein GDA46_04735 [Bdellovibrionales bacterium]|nr:hypothetical protein [Bdellovibrionales bacterium]